jgi:hypothetical protein
MRSWLAILFLLLSYKQGIAQKLDGEWKGSFTYADFPDRVPIKLHFVPDRLYTYKVYSYTKGQDARGNDTIVVCRVFYKVTWKDSICLEETKVLLPKKPGDACFQRMFLKIKLKENGLVLEGNWEDITSKKCYGGYGSIIFEKQ